MQINVIYHDNLAGLSMDAKLIGTQLSQSHEVNYIDFVKMSNLKKADLNIFMQGVGLKGDMLLKLAGKNIIFINQEWLNINELSNINTFDLVCCKTNYAKRLIQDFSNKTVFTGFTSEDCYLKIDKTRKFLHFSGLSKQKNTELINKYKDRFDITIQDSHINYINHEYKKKLISQYQYHLCPSFTEGWGHYIFEAMSTFGTVILPDCEPFNEIRCKDSCIFINAKKFMDENVEFCSTKAKNFYPLRECFKIDEAQFCIVIEILKEKTPDLNTLAREYFLECDYKFKENLKYIINNI